MSRVESSIDTRFSAAWHLKATILDNDTCHLVPQVRARSPVIHVAHATNVSGNPIRRACALSNVDIATD
jgi:hypothetical protein